MTENALAASQHDSETFALLQRYISPPPLMVVISGPAGVGKDSVLRRLRERGLPYHFVVTTTDRQIRGGEVNGVDYHFVTTKEFQCLIDNDALLEYATVYDQHKGVPKDQVQIAMQSGLDVILRLDVQGAAIIREKYPQAISVFLAPPSFDLLLRRLRGRGGDTDGQLRRRLDTAVAELARAHEFDYVVVNHESKLEATVDRVVAILAAERCRTSREAVVF